EPAKSEMYRRITATDPKKHMPPPQSGRKLSDKQVELLRQWMAVGAKWEKHWSFIPPRRPPLPVVKQRDWPRNAIDYFLLERLEREGLVPASPAEKTTLLRRATFDLTGLPPTLAEIDAFLADTTASAYEKVVDPLLSS